MSRGGSGMVAIVAGTALTLLMLAAPAGAADTAKFTVTYTGSGDFTSKTTGHITNNNGRCKDTSTEDTTFSFAGLVGLKATFTDKGMTGDSTLLSSRSNDWQALHNNPSEFTKVSTGPGCHPPDGSNISGSYDCTGAALPTSPNGLSKFTLSDAGSGERSHLKAIGPLFFGSGFSGQWVYDVGSCHGAFQSVPLLQTEALALPFDLGIRVPIREKTLRNLKVHHYFKVDVGEGHHAPQVNDAKRCRRNGSLDTCKQTFTWTGRVTVRRTG